MMREALTLYRELGDPYGQASALIGVAKSDLYPRFALTGSIGLLSSDTNQSDLSDLFDSDSIAYSFGPAASWNVLNYGRLKNQVRVQDARLEQLIVNYQNTVLDAAREVEDGLAGFQGSRASASFLADSVASAQRSVDLSLIQYREGATDFHHQGKTISVTAPSSSGRGISPA